MNGALGSGGTPASIGSGSGGVRAASGGVAAAAGSQTTSAAGGAVGGSGAPGGSGGTPAGAAGAASGGVSSGAGQGGGSSAGGSVSSGGTTGVTCQPSMLSPGNSTHTLQVGGKARTYVLHVPSGYSGSKPVPFIVDFHPLGGSGPGEQTGSPYPSVVDGEGVIMAFPSGLAGPSGGAWNVGPCCVDNVDDVEFAKALVAEVKGLACVDPKRVYAVGFSMGGGMAHYVGCHAADVFAAVAPAAFDLLQENEMGCTPPRPITVVSFRGTADPIVPYAGGYSSVVSGHPITFLGAVGTMKKWAEIDGCSGSAADIGGGCQGYASSQCKDGVEVILCTKQGGSHEPGNATTAWPVLKRHTLP